MISVPHRYLLNVLALLMPAIVLHADEKQDVPLKQVVLYSSGVGYFDRAGKVKDNAQIELKFNIEQVNDLLKSMVVQDLNGGKVSTISYTSRDPITRTLKTFSIDLTSNPTIAELLTQARGEAVEITVPPTMKITGTILGVEKVKQQVKEDVIIQEMVTILTENGLQRTNLQQVGAIKLLNPKLDQELRQALQIIALGHAQDKKSVTLNFLGQGERNVRIGYIQETPIWKTSYRLVMEDDKPSLLQGWAIVENTTEEDWKEIDLTLMSGRPISFQMDLYQPLYVNRPTVVPELYSSLMPRTYEQDLVHKEREFLARNESELRDSNKLVDKKAEKQLSMGRNAAAAAPGAFGGGGLGGGTLAGTNRRGVSNADFGSTLASVADAQDAGELFQYHIQTPVNLERRRSAMLPIVGEPITVQKLSIYNVQTHAKHPLYGLKMKNSTKLHLMQGPITVYSEGAYAGDAQIRDIPPGSERLISYAMDLDTEVSSVAKSQADEITSLKIVKGVLHSRNRQQRQADYTIKNSGKKEKLVLVEHPIDNTWKLVSPKEPAEKTRDHYRFAVTAKPGTPAELKVQEEFWRNETIAITNMNDNNIRILLSSSVATEGIKKAFQEVAKRKLEQSQVANKLQGVEAQTNVIKVEQERIRQNMAQLDRTSELYIRYVKKFGQQEDEMEALRTQISQLQNDLQKLKKSLDEYLANLDLE